MRQAFYKPRVTFHPASVELGGQRFGIGSGDGKRKEKEKERKGEKGEKEKGLEKDREKVISSAGSSSSTIKETTGGFLKAFTNAASSLSTSHSSTIATSSRGKERAHLVSSTSTSSTKTIIAQAQQLDFSSSTTIPTSTSSLSSMMEGRFEYDYDNTSNKVNEGLFTCYHDQFLFLKYRFLSLLVVLSSINLF